MAKPYNFNEQLKKTNTMQIKTPYGAHPATVENFMQYTGIGEKLEALRQKYNGALIITFYSEHEPILIEVGGNAYLLDLPEFQLFGTLEVSYDSTRSIRFRIETADDLYTILNSHLNRNTK